MLFFKFRFLCFYCHINLHVLFNDKAILLEEQQWCNLTHSWEDKGVHTFPKGIYPKANAMAWLELELGFYSSALAITPQGHPDLLFEQG